MNTTILLIFCILTLDLCAQPSEKNEVDLERLSDEMAGLQDLDGDHDDLYENLAQILSSPYDLNTVTGEELTLLHILSDQQIQNFLDYRKEQGRFVDIFELQVIPDFDLPVISRLIPFIKVTDPLQAVDRSLLKRIFSAGHSYFITRYERTLEFKRGFKSSAAQGFNGSPDKVYFRFRSALPGDFSLGLTGEKDPGEKLMFNIKKYQYGFDFLSCHLQLQNKGRLKNLIIGDFQTQFAQGLILGGAFGLGKGGETVSTTRKSNLGFLPYASINEVAYLRGAGLTVQAANNIDISVFYSLTKRDASSSAADHDILTVTSFQTTGLHRSLTELGNRKKVTEQNYGMVVRYYKNRLDAGIIFNALHFDIPVRKTPTAYNQFAFEGSKSINTGFFLNYRIRNFAFFSEAAQSIQGGKGGIAGWLIHAHKNLDVSLLYRKYAPSFYGFYSNAFSENTQPQNERGLYWGWKYRWNRQYNLTGYADLFAFPWLGFRRYAPAQGYECLLKLTYQPVKKIAIFAQARAESKQRNLPEVNTLYQLKEGLRRNITLNCDYGIGENLRLKSRFQYSSYFFDKETSEGMALVQDIHFSIGRFQFTGRHALFTTDSYDNRLYIYENDVWLSFSLPAYDGSGVRNYALMEYTIHKQLTLWVRYARTRITNADVIGTGQDAIEGNTKNDVKFQVRMKF